MNRSQRGAFNVVATATLVVVVLIVALALDTGRFYLERQRLQGVVDAAALAAVRELNAHADAAAIRDAVQQGALRAARQNGFQGDLAGADAIVVGHTESGSGEYRFVEGCSDDGLCNAVRVRARHAVPRSLVAPGLLPGETTLVATAVARQEAIGQIQVGSFLLRAEILKPVLGGLLGSDVSLLSYDRLAGAQLRLGDLKAAVGAETTDELLDTNLSLGQFLRVGAEALRRGGDELAAVQLNAWANAVANPAPIRIGDLIAVTSDDAAVLDGRLDAFGLLMAAAQLANRDRQVSGIALDADALGLTGVGRLRLDLQVREAPRAAIGPPGFNPVANQWRTRAHNGQVELTLHVDLAGLGLVDVKVQTAGADAWLKSITAATPSATGTPHSSAELGATTQPVSLSLALPGVASASADTRAVAMDPITCTGPFPETETIGTPSGSALGELVRSLRVRILGLSVPVPGAELVAGLLAPVGDRLLDPLLQALGVRLGGADISVIYLNPGQPRLVQ